MSNLTCSRRAALLAPMAIGLTAAIAPGRGYGASAEGRWEEIRRELFGDRPIEEAGRRLDLTTPPRAEDAAIVPIHFAASTSGDGRDQVHAVHLIIDNNPAPLAGVFRFPAGGAEPAVATRIRINEYTPVRIVAETADGRLLGAERFVKASGGCSAPAGKDQVAALARLGRMKLNGVEAVRIGQRSPLQLLISHPNNSGLQFDQISRTYVPPHYLHSIEVRFGDRMVFAVDADISISEDPSFHFAFVPEAPGRLVARAADTKGGVYEQAWALGGLSTGG